MLLLLLLTEEEQSFSKQNGLYTQLVQEYTGKISCSYTSIRAMVYGISRTNKVVVI
jgi:hypothetical protein